MKDLKGKGKAKRSVKKLSSKKYGEATGSMSVDEDWQGLTSLADSDTDNGEEAKESDAGPSDGELEMEKVKSKGGFGPENSSDDSE